jgi:hypothetical protein
MPEPGAQHRHEQRGLREAVAERARDGRVDRAVRSGAARMAS